MIIKNNTKKTTVAKNCKQATTLAEIVFGLHWLTNSPELLFKTRFGLHTLLLQRPIDVLVLDRKFKVVKAKEGLIPNQIFVWNPRYFWVLELPEGAISKSKTQEGDQLSFDPKPQS
jgi:uncharacterized membrane protein (UPF0127 family)